MQRLFRSRVAVATEPSSGFFLVGNQHDSDDDGTPDQVETSLGLDPFDPDTDGDGVPDGRELLAGSDPFAADTDGDGLPDSVELSWGRIATNGLSRWIDLSESTNRIVLFSDADDDAVYVPVPVDFRLFGRTMTNLAVNANGLVGWSAGEPPFRAGRSSNDRPGRIPLSDDPSATAAAFWDDLRVRPSMESCVSLVSSGTDGAKTAVIEFSNMGFVSGGSNDFVSFQVQFSEAETNAVLVVFSEASGRGTGSSATVGARSTRDDGIAYAFNEPDSVFPGLAVECHFGFGSDPSKTDTDGDGLPDGDELAAGTDPRLADTDGDGLSDGEEDAVGTDPRSPNDGDDAVDADPDGDGLSNGMGSFVGTDWHLADTDGDGVSDGAEWRQGSDPLDPADSASRDTVETTIRFGDESGSHSEKYEATVTPVSGDTRPPVKLRNREFGEPDELTVHLVSNAVYAVSLRHVASNRPSPDLDYTLGISATDVSSGYASADDVVIGSAGAEYPSSDFARLLANPDKGVSLIEGLKASYEPLELELRLDGRTALQMQLPLLIVPVEGFYRWINFRGIADGPVSKSTDVSAPLGFPDSESNGKNVVFVHGFNVTEREARGWNAEMFKRLWQSGCNAKYHAVTWYGDVGFPNGMYYHSDANNAFLTAADLATYVSGLSGPAGTRVLEFTQNQTINASRNIDMATFKDDSTWPVNTFFGTRWLHSDFKAVALPNVFGLFNEFCTKGNLK